LSLAATKLLSMLTEREYVFGERLTALSDTETE
jgi:hypothetical protein